MEGAQDWELSAAAAAADPEETGLAALVFIILLYLRIQEEQAARMPEAAGEEWQATVRPQSPQSMQGEAVLGSAPTAFLAAAAAAETETLQEMEAMAGAAAEAAALIKA